MNGFPVELVFFLFFGIAVLFNILKQRAARKQRAQAALNPAEQEEVIPEEVWRAQSAAERTPPASEVPVRRRAEMPAALPRRAPRRFARQTLLGTRRKVQDAFVLATILGPCRGDEPHEIR